MIRIMIPGEMRGKGRPRFSARTGFVRAYTDTKTANAETWVRACAMEQAGRQLIAGPVSLDMDIAIAPAASWSKRKRDQALLGDIFPAGKPDLDNCLKLVADALNGIIWHDDRQIVRVVARKFYAAEPSTTLRICEL